MSCPIPLSWSAIATRPRMDHQTRELIWTPLSEPVLTIGEARALAAEGRIFMATKHMDDRLLLLVKRAQQPLYVVTTLIAGHRPRRPRVVPDQDEDDSRT